VFSIFRKKKKLSLERRLFDQLDIIKSRIDLDKDIVDQYMEVKKSETYLRVFDRPDPLVTISISTYNRGKLLTSRGLPSLLGQTYKNIEVIIVGDCCTDDTAERIKALGDDRVTFVNLESRGDYPESGQIHWMVAGTKPFNFALTLAKGDFITHLDDDDRHPLDRIEKLVRFAQENKADFVWHPFYREKGNGKWRLTKAKEYRSGSVTTSSVFYHNWFKCIPADFDAWRFREAGDWNRFRKFKYLGVNACFYPEPMLFHYKERNQ
jgi:glycosyltransferase involved in cell wall biosynthesis